MTQDPLAPLQELVERLEVLERTCRRQDGELAQIRRELQAFGLQLPAVNPAGVTPLSPQAARASRLIRAARARAAKRVEVDAQGRAGMATLRTERTKARLLDEADDLLRRLRGGADDDDDEA
jgi:sugar phosphate isomerase/epimerase